MNINLKAEPQQTVYSDYLLLLEEFKALYQGLNISIPADSFLQKTMDNLVRMTEYKVTFKNDYIELPFNEEELRAIAFLPHILDSIDNINKLNDKQIIKKHLMLLPLAKISQNDATLNRKYEEWSDSNKIWELMILIALINIDAEILKVGDPFNSEKQSEVDIIAKIDDVTWGFECKVLTTGELKPDTLIGLIQKGAEQIEKTINIDYGIVCLNMRNIIKHDKYLKSIGSNLYTYFDNFKAPHGILVSEIQNNTKLLNNFLKEIIIHNNIKKEKKQIKYLDEMIFKSSKKVRKGWFDYYSTTSICYHNYHIAIDFIQQLSPFGIQQKKFFLENELSMYLNNGLFKSPKYFNMPWKTKKDSY
jgi:hypothetical protein